MAAGDASTVVWLARLNRPHHQNVNNCDECCVGCCKNNSNDNSYNNSYRNNSLIKAARVLSVVSVSVSWIYPVFFALDLVGMAVIQTLGRRRITDDYFRCASFGAWIAALLCALAQFWLALNIYSRWWDASWCDPWTLETGGRFDNRWDDSCPQKTLASVAVVCGILWTMVFGCLVRFRIVNGRFQNHNHNNDNDNDANDDGNSRNSLVTDARVLSVVSIAVSWIWWVTFAIGLVGMAVIQVLGRRHNNGFCSSIAMLGAQLAALVCAVAQFWLAHHIYSDWWDVSWCEPWTLETGGQFDHRWDWCPHKTWASVALVCGILWTMVLGYLVRFRIVHGRFQNHNNNTSGTNANANNNKDADEAVESGNEASAEPAASVAIPLAESTEVESC